MVFTVIRIEEPVKECHRPHAGVSEFYKQHIHSGKYSVGILRKEMFPYKSDCFPLVGSNFAFFKYLVERKVSYRPQHCALRAGQKANNKSAQGEKKGGVFPKTVL